jgi:hypothetical protein
MKTKLKSGEMSIWGDQWPLFLYVDLAYDPDDPWNGLLRSQLLVAVCENYSIVYFLLIIDFRDSNTFSRLPAPSMMMNQSYKVGKCAPSWYGKRQQGVTCIHFYPGTILIQSAKMPLLM